jgi:hypothetical protein
MAWLPLFSWGGLFGRQAGFTEKRVAFRLSLTASFNGLAINTHTVINYSGVLIYVNSVGERR